MYDFNSGVSHEVTGEREAARRYYYVCTSSFFSLIDPEEIR